MKRCLLGIAVLTSFIILTSIIVATASVVLAQETKTETPVQTTTVTQTTATQNPDGSWTVVEYPVGKEVVVDLTPTSAFPGATGIAHITRADTGTMINLDLKGLPADTANARVYAVDPTGKVVMLGPVTVNNGIAQLTTTTPLNQFMLVLSPDPNLTTIAPDTRVILRSAVPSGFAVVPLASSGERDGAAVGEKVAATTTPVATPAYSAPMLGIGGFRRGTDTEMKINFSGPLVGARANVSIEPRHDGPTTIVMRFHEMKDAPASKVYVLWAVSPDNKLVRLGQVVNTGKRNEAEIKTETSLPDFGLFVSLEESNSLSGNGEGSTPTGTIVGTVIK